MVHFVYFQWRWKKRIWMKIPANVMGSFWMACPTPKEVLEWKQWRQTPTRGHYSETNKPLLQESAPKPTLSDLLRKQGNDTLCRDYRARHNGIDSPHLMNGHRILSRGTFLDETTQLIFPTILNPAILYHVHRPTLTGLLRESRLSDARRRMYHWLCTIYDA